MDIDKLIEELYGMGTTSDMGHLKDQEIDAFQGSGLNRQHTPSKFPKIGDECGHKLSGWQVEVYNRYRQGRRDAIISVPPAAGKTGPVLCSWRAEFLKFLEDKLSPQPRGVPLPRIAFVVPTTQLAFQIAKQDFLRDGTFGLLRMVAQNPQLFQQIIQLNGGRPITNLIGQTPQGGRYSPAITDGTTSPSRDPRTGKVLRSVDVLANNTIGPPNTRDQNQPQLNRLTQSDINKIYEFVNNEFVGLLVGGGGQAAAYPSSTRGIFGQIKPIIVGTYEPMTKLMDKYGKLFNIVCIDETQQFIGVPGSQSVGKDVEKKQKEFINIIRRTPRTSSLFLMTGSVNDNTVESIKDLINKEFKRELTKIPKNLPKNQKEARDTGQANRSKINIMPYDKMQQKEDIIKLVKDIVRKKQTNSIMLLFSVKRMTVGGIFRLIEDIVVDERMPIINKEYVRSEKPSKLIDREDVRIKKIKVQREIVKLEKLLKDSAVLSNEDYELIKNQLTNLKLGRTDKNSVAKVEKSLNDLEDKLENLLRQKNPDKIEYDKIKTQINDLRKVTSHELTSKQMFKNDHSRNPSDIDDENFTIKNVDTYDRHIRDKNGDMTVADLADREANDFISDKTPVGLDDGSANVDDIEFLKYFDIKAVEDGFRGRALERANPDNLLYQAALRGIGVMVGSMHQRHKEAIQKLFKSGKLPVLFASDALGVGANVNCKHLYIPKLDKFDAGEFVPLDSSSLVQLINRAGRKGKGDLTVANVYCGSGDYEKIKRFIEEDPRVAVDEIDPVPFGSLERYAKEHGKFATLTQMYKLFSNSK
jgi:hypothetical protein